MDNVLIEKKVLNIDKSTWKLTKLGDLLEDISQRVDNPSQSGYDRFVGLDHFLSGDIKIKNWGTTENLTSSTKAFKAGDILFARRNAYLRRASLVDFDGCCSGDAFVLRENHNKVVPGFLSFFMNSNTVWDFANENAAGTMSKRVKWRDLANYEFLLPPKDQQAQLAKLLWALDMVIEKELKLLKACSNLKNSLSNDLLLGKHLAGAKNKKSPYGFIPDKWSLVNLYDLRDPKDRYSFTGGPFGSDLKSEHYTDQGVRILQLQNIGEGEFLDNYSIFTSEEKADELSSCNIYPNEIILAKMAPVARCCIVPSNDKRYVMSSDGIRLKINKELYDNKFVYHALNSTHFRRFAETKSTGSTRGRIGLNELKRILIPMPESLDRQKEIADQLDLIDINRDNCKAKIESTKALQKSIINQVF
ncbi:MAG: restriction endonuclease subunit S [Melioribacteraceae bacterium]|nr:restriction endonuclease subunit S [Melioribacteraceae bacterium]